VLFFVSVGMLFDPAIIVEQPGPVLATLFIILIGKSFAAYVIVRAFKYPVGTGLMVAASLAQIGEFSFILADMGIGLNLLPKEGRDLILAGAILSMVLNPAAFFAAEKIRIYLGGRTDAPKAPEAAEPVAPPLHQTALAGHTVLVGFGRVGSLVAESLKQMGLPFVVIEDATKPVAKLKTMGAEVVIGNAAKEDVLRAANVAGAKRLILAIPNTFEGGQALAKAKAANPALTVIARAHSDDEVEYLTKLGAAVVIMGEREIARGIVEHITA
jgi:CPA2 family monovalent cation:H+ antiporter-2